MMREPSLSFFLLQYSIPLWPMSFTIISLIFSPMQSCFSLVLAFGIVLSLAYVANCNLSAVSNGQTAKSLAPRQIPGVISNSDFLRRGGHACESTSSLASRAQVNHVYSRCRERLGIYRWRRVFISERRRTKLSVL